MTILIFLIILLVLVLVHEAGHFLSAKKFGIRVDEFGFGFPPKLFSYKKGETKYSFNLLPVGGFVKIFGENPDDENTFGPDASRSFVNKPKYQQAIVLSGGVFANFILAWLLFSIGFMSGLPTSVGNEVKGSKLNDVNLVVVSVLDDSPAHLAGLKSGDKIVFVNYKDEEKNVDEIMDINPETLKSFILNHEGDVINIGYVRGKNKEFKMAEMEPKIISGVPAIGISMDMIGVSKLPFFTALKEGMSLTLYMIKGTVVGLYTLITQSLQGNGSFTAITGPVGMVGIVGDAYQFGFVYLLSFSALISINLAVINLFPFPALDGGRLLFLFIEKVKGSRLNPKITNMVNMIGFGVLILLMLVITYHDVVKLF